jgi:hypothetical protein
MTAEVTNTRSLADDFDRRDPAAQQFALSFFAPHWDEITQIFGGFYSDAHLKDTLARLLRKYARDVAGKDGSGLKFSEQEKEAIKDFDDAMSLVRGVVWRVQYLDGMDNLEFLLLNSGFDEPALHELRERAEAFSVAVAQLGKDLGGRPLKNVHFEILIKEVATMYEWANGHLAIEAVHSDQRREDTFFGGFFQLAEMIESAAADATGREKKSNIALGTILKRVLED